MIITSNLLIYPGSCSPNTWGIPSIGTLLVPICARESFLIPPFFRARRELCGRGNLLTYDLFNEVLWQLYRGSMN